MSDDLLDLPEGWELVKLEDTTIIILGQSPPSSSYNDEKIGLPFYQGKTEFGELYPIPRKWCSLPGKIAEKGDVLISVRAPVGPTNICEEKSCIGRGLAAIRGLGGIKTFFLLYVIRNFDKNLAEKATGTTFEAISGNTLREFKIPLPPLNEQKRIVAKIEELNDRSQTAQKALETIPQLCDRFRQSVLAAAFRGDLTADWREKNPDVEPASVLLERIKNERRQKWEEEELKKFNASGKIPKDDKWKEKYKEPQELEKIDNVELSELPDGWLWMSADECTSWITDGEHATPERSDSGVYLLSARNVLDGKISLQKVDFISEQVHKKLEERLKIESGDVFLSCSGTVGRSCVVPPDLKCSLVRSVAVLKPLFNMGEYLSLAIRSPCIQAQIEGKKTQTAQSNIFQGRIKILAIPVAPLNEQKQIVSLIEKYFKIIETIEKQHQQATEKLEKLNQSILSKAFRGELVPQDPEDEPASVLLERIRAEREKLNNSKPKSTGKRKGKTPKEQGTIPGLE